MNIVLIGFASSGKTTIGKKLSDYYMLSFVDLDRKIESIFAKKNGEKLVIREIFQRVGKTGFIRLENDALNALQGITDTVISTGGHAPVTEENRALIKKLGTVVYLKVSSRMILSRMRKKGIPSSIEGGEAGLVSEMNYREPLYLELSDIVVDSDEFSSAETVQAIVRALKTNNP